MGRKRTPGLKSRNGMWHIDKRLEGYGRLCQSCGTGDLEEAERFYARRLEEIRKAIVYGVRPTRTFREAATKYLHEGLHKRSISRDAQDLTLVEPYIGDTALQHVHMGTLQPFIDDRRNAGVRSDGRRRKGAADGTISRTLSIVRRVLNLAARLWRDEHGLTWLETAPMIQLLPDRNRRKPYPLGWDEQDLLFGELPEHLREMCLYKVNTGCREQEVCKLRWSWEVRVVELAASVFIIPEDVAKNGKERVIVLNREAQAVVDRQRGKHADMVFTYPVSIHEDPDNRRSPILGVERQPTTKLYNSAWKRARQVAAERYQDEIGQACPFGFAKLRVHDLRHTFGRRLRAMNVSLEDRQDLLGHESGRMTTHYSAAEIGNLIEAVNRICPDSSRKSHAITFLRIADMRVSA